MKKKLKLKQRIEKQSEKCVNNNIEMVIGLEVVMSLHVVYNFLGPFQSIWLACALH